MFFVNYFEKYKFSILTAIVALYVLGALAYSRYIKPPIDFPVPIDIEIISGEGLKEVSEKLFEARVIRSPLWFSNFVIALGGEKTLQASRYHFDRPMNAVSLAYRISNGIHGMQSIKVTIPEGYNINDIAELLDKSITGFQKQQFISEARVHEGYLFPDTYFLLPDTKPSDIIKKMRGNFELKTKVIRIPDNKTLKDIIIMASLIEEEVATNESRELVSGILWKRLEIGMPLQVDASVSYVVGKNTFELTSKDLETDSKYNTYKYKGLPVGPITNPGLNAINAAIYPKNSPYLYYLSDKEGNIYYGRTLDEHNTNKALYLKGM